MPGFGTWFLCGNQDAARSVGRGGGIGDGGAVQRGRNCTLPLRSTASPALAMISRSRMQAPIVTLSPWPLGAPPEERGRLRPEGDRQPGGGLGCRGPAPPGDPSGRRAPSTPGPESGGDAETGSLPRSNPRRACPAPARGPWSECWRSSGVRPRRARCARGGCPESPSL